MGFSLPIVSALNYGRRYWSVDFLVFFAHDYFPRGFGFGIRSDRSTVGTVGATRPRPHFFPRFFPRLFLAFEPWCWFDLLTDLLRCMRRYLSV